MDSVRHFRFSLIILVTVVAIGACGYMAIEERPLFDTLYMTVITLSTVGDKEVHTLTPLGQAFTLFLIIAGCGISTGATLITRSEPPSIMQLETMAQGHVHEL